MTDPRHNQIDYIEFSVKDMKSSKEFYSQVFGWEFTDYSPTYAGIKGRNFEAGGFSVVDEIIVGTTLIVLYSQDLEATIGAVKEAGGKVSKEIFSFPGGRRFHFSDPSGNEIAVWTQA